MRVSSKEIGYAAWAARPPTRFVARRREPPSRLSVLGLIGFLVIVLLAWQNASAPVPWYPRLHAAYWGDQHIEWTPHTTPESLLDGKIQLAR